LVFRQLFLFASGFNTPPLRGSAARFVVTGVPRKLPEIPVFENGFGCGLLPFMDSYEGNSDSESKSSQGNI
jgi:hypothetical protein